MKNNVVLDTNILIYYLDKSSIHNKYSKDIVKNSGFNFCLTTKNISEFCAVLSKIKDFEYSDIEKELNNLLNSFMILYPNEYSLNIFNSLIHKYKPSGNRVYDIEIVSIMLAYNINKIATVNTSDFKDIDEVEII